MAAGFLLILAHQATWQLAGQRKPEFVAFMQLHDRRAFNPAHRIQRGRILDRNGAILAESLPDSGSRMLRFYPFGAASAHVVGYTHPLFGSYGMERAANASLVGASLTSLEEWRQLGRGIFDAERTIVGRNLELTLDANLQQKAFNALAGKAGAVVLMDSRDGDLLVLTSRPSFDPNVIDSALFSGARGSTVLLNRATQGLYPPGSTYKIITAATALEADFSGRLACPADGWTTSPGNPRIRDHEYYSARRKGQRWGGHGQLDLGTALAKSSNVFFAQLGVLCGLETMRSGAHAFHLDKNLVLHREFGLQLTGSARRFPDLSERDRYGLAQISMGQGRMLTTPLLMTVATAAIANGGQAPQPRLSLSTPPQLLERSVSAASAQQLAAMMRRVVTEGTGRSIASSALQVAGKTGTAENPHGASHAWFVGFAPADAPRYAVGVLVEQGGYGSVAALPIAHEMLQLAMKKYPERKKEDSP
jgi:peptidoglycan glycosyltransferase